MTQQTTRIPISSIILEPGWIKEALSLNYIEAVEAYSVWGGVPRYWELAKIYRNQEEACKEIVLDRDGVLHNEPMRLLLDDMRGASQPHSLLSLIANGSNRVSEIAGRLGKPAQRWWGNGRDGKNMEIDMIAESLNNEFLLFGEVKWEAKTNIKNTG